GGWGRKKTERGRESRMEMKPTRHAATRLEASTDSGTATLERAHRHMEMRKQRVGRARRRWGENGDTHHEHRHGDREEDTEVAQEKRPGEGTRRDLVSRTLSATLDLVAHRRGTSGYAGLERGGRASVHADDAVAPLQRDARL